MLLVLAAQGILNPEWKVTGALSIHLGDLVSMSRCSYTCIAFTFPYPILSFPRHVCASLQPRQAIVSHKVDFRGGFSDIAILVHWQA
jgi:hypothetical protein